MKNNTFKHGAWLLMLTLPFFATTVYAVAVTAIAASSGSSGHTCAVTINGDAQCWGYNASGELGDGTTTQRLKPVNVKGLSRGSISGVSAGGNNSCALTKGGGVKCWGGGRLGNGTNTMSLIPVDVIGLSSGVIAIAASNAHRCALMSTGGVKCWGSNNHGQLGDGTVMQKLSPVDVVGLGGGVTAIAVGERHSCALMSTSGVKCWGDNELGQLGDGTTGDALWRWRLTPVDVVGLSSGVIAISVGYAHSCALTSAGAVMCWGSNATGQLGDGTTGVGIQSYRLTPVNVVGLSSGVIAITTGGRHSCALTNVDGIKCWGNNEFGGLGDGTTNTSLVPRSVTGLSSVITSITAGQYHTCVLTNTAAMKCWGENSYGQLGDGTTGPSDNSQLTPVDVLFELVKNDYNNRGLAGWYWKGQSNGMQTFNEIWLLTFPLYSESWAIPNRLYPPPFADQVNWDIATTGDFNKDGDADILWRHNTLATWKVWQIQNGQRVAQNTPADFDLAHEWQVIGAGDTDKDGDDDVILNKASTGEVLVWEMQNHAIANTHSVGTKAGYVLNRIGDFNKDGDVDLLFRQVGTDVLITWELQANTFVAERALAVTGAGYNPVCAGDFDADGDDDIMLMNSATTQEKWFVMESYTRTQAFGSLNTGFEFQGCGDYDGDGDADMKSIRISDSINRIVLQTNVLQPGLGVIKQTVYTNPYGNGYGFVYRGNSN